MKNYIIAKSIAFFTFIIIYSTSAWAAPRAKYLLVYEGGDPTDKACQVTEGKNTYHERNVPRKNLEGQCDDLTGYDFSGADLHKRDFKGALFDKATLTKTNFSGARLEGARFSNGDSAGMNLKDSFLTQAEFSDQNLLGADFRGAYGIRPAFSRTDITVAKFQSSNLKHAYFNEAVGSNVHFEDATLNGALFDNAQLPRAHFENANLTLGKMRNVTIENGNFSGADLEGINFFGNFRGSDFRGAKLDAFQVYDHTGQSNVRTSINPSFNGSDLRDCDFRGTDLSKTDLRNTKLQGAKIDWSTKLPFSHNEAIQRGMILEGEPLSAFDTSATSATIRLVGSGSNLQTERVSPQESDRSIIDSTDGELWLTNSGDGTVRLERRYSDGRPTVRIAH